MPDQGIALDPHATVLLAGFDAEATILIPSHHRRRAEAVTGGFVRPTMPGVDCVALPGAHRRSPRPSRFARLARLLSHAAPLLVAAIGIVCVVCMALFIGSVNP